MTWRLKGWGLVVGPAWDVEGVKAGSGGGARTLKQHRAELVRGYLAPPKVLGL